MSAFAICCPGASRLSAPRVYLSNVTRIETENKALNKTPKHNRPPRRLYVFDIDGTLINTGGAGSAAMRAAFQAVWRVEDGFRRVEFSGRSDLAIFEDALRDCEADDCDFREAVRRFKRAYFRRLPLFLEKHDGRVLPGVPALLERLASDSCATLVLGTGNFRTSAGIKLKHYGLHEYFKSRGGFGDRTGHRPTLIGHGITAATRKYGKHASVFVIGDTVHDINAAKSNGAIAVGVATGMATEADLRAAGADIVYRTLEDAADLIGS
ncbi:MAG TPA: HAD family hydrolase [Dehalococcoidia bacterium]|nr:HAD family hydrolase [Dehalococcoidia bacterium]